MSSDVEIHLRAYDEASSVIDSVGSNLSVTFNDIEGNTQSLVSTTDEATSQIASDYNQVTEAGSNLQEQQTESQASFGKSAMAMNSLALSGAALFMSFERVEKAQITVDRANLNVLRSTEAAEKAQTAYNVAVEKYGVDSPQAKDATDKLAIATEAHRVSIERADMASTNMNTTMLTSALTVIPALISIIGAVGGAEQIWTGIQAALNAVMDANPIAIVILAIAGLVAVVIAAYTYCTPFRDAINAIGSALSAVFKPAIDAVSGALSWLWTNILQPVGAFLSAMFTYDIQVVTGAFQWLANVLKPVADFLGAIAGAIGNAWNAVAGAVGGACSAIGGAITAGVNSDVAVVTNGYNAISGAVGSAMNAATDLVLGFTGQTKAYYEAWETSSIAAVNDAMEKQKAKIEETCNAEVAKVQDALSKQLDEIKSKYAEIADVENKRFDEEYTAFIKHYTDIIEPPKSALDKVLEKYKSHYDSLISETTKQFDRETSETTKHYDDLIHEVESSLNTQKQSITNAYNDQINTVRQEYSDEINATRSHYDDMIGAVNAGLKAIQNARKGDLDNLELNMLEQKEKLKTARDSQQMTEADYQKAVSALDKTYNDQRSATNDSYRLKELEYEKAHAGEVEGLTKEKNDKLTAMANDEKTALTKAETDKNDAVKAAETAANANIVALNQEKTDKLKSIANQEKDAITKIEQEKSAKIKEIQDASAALEKQHADNIAAIEKAKNTEITAAETDAQEKIKTITQKANDDTNTIVNKAETEKQRIIAESGKKIEGSTNDVWSNVGKSISDFASSAYDTISNTFSNIGSTISNAMGGVKDTISNALGDSWNAISGFIGSICFAHALQNAALDSEKTMKTWNDMISEKMDKGLSAIKAFNAEAGITGAPGAGIIGAGGVPVPTAKSPVVLNVTAPLVNVEGSADKATVDLASKQVLETLKSIIVEPTSASAPAVMKRIRQSSLVR